MRQVRSHIRHSTFNISKNCTHKKVEVRTKAVHVTFASPDTTRPIALKTDFNYTSLPVCRKVAPNACKMRPDKQKAKIASRFLKILWPSFPSLVKKCASRDTTRPNALKTDSKSTSDMSKNDAKRVRSGVPCLEMQAYSRN